MAVEGHMGDKQRLTGMTELALMGPGGPGEPKTLTRSAHGVGQDPESRAHCRHGSKHV